MFVGEDVGRPMVQYAEDISKESIIDVRGTLVKTPSPVSGCTQKAVELKIEEVREERGGAGALMRTHAIVTCLIASRPCNAEMEGHAGSKMRRGGRGKSLRTAIVFSQVACPCWLGCV